MTRQQYMMMKKSLEDEFKRHLKMKDLEAAQVVAQLLRVKCPEVKHAR